MKKLFLILALAFVGAACQNSVSDAQKQYEQKMQTVLDGHDVLMKDMSKVSHFIQQLESTVPGNANEEEIQIAIEDLKSANQAMFDWMHDFNQDFPDAYKKDKTFSEEEYKENVELLEKHEKTLEELEAHFKKSIAQAEKLVEAI